MIQSLNLQRRKEEFMKRQHAEEKAAIRFEVEEKIEKVKAGLDEAKMEIYDKL